MGTVIVFPALSGAVHRQKWGAGKELIWLRRAHVLFHGYMTAVRAARWRGLRRSGDQWVSCRASRIGPVLAVSGNGVEVAWFLAL